jgi:hypothetical protein
MGNAIARQDWTTVVLEIFIVVIGIFLGLQVNGWNDTRQFRKLEALYLAKLEDDLSAMRVEVSRNLELSESMERQMSRALFALEACDTSESAQADLRLTLERYQVQPPIRFRGATYDEMVETGALARMSHDVVKQQIANVFSSLADLNANQRGLRVSIPVVDAIVWQKVSFSVERDSGRPIASFDMRELCDDREFRNAVVEMIDLQHDTASGSRRGLRAIDELLATLEASGD